MNYKYTIETEVPMTNPYLLEEEKDYSKPINALKDKLKQMSKDLSSVQKAHAKMEKEEAKEKDEKENDSPEAHQAAMDHFKSLFVNAKRNKDEQGANDAARNYHDYANKLSSMYQKKLKEDSDLEEAEDKMVELEDLAKQKADKHRFLVTYSDPHHSSVSMRKVKQQKHVKVPAWNKKKGETVFKGDAEPLVKHYMKKQGYKVHEVEHVGMVTEEHMNPYLEEANDFSKWSTEKLQKHWNTHKDEERQAPVFANQLKKVAQELAKRKKAIKEEADWVQTGKTATHAKTGQKTFEWAKVDKDGKRTGERCYRNAKGEMMGESMEQIDEVSTSTLSSYLQKAHKRQLPVKTYDRQKGMIHKDAPGGKEISSQEAGRRISKHLIGIKRAQDKMLKNVNKNVKPSSGDYGKDIQKQYYSGPSGSRTGD